MQEAFKEQRQYEIRIRWNIGLSKYPSELDDKLKAVSALDNEGRVPCSLVLGLYFSFPVVVMEPVSSLTMCRPQALYCLPKALTCSCALFDNFHLLDSKLFKLFQTSLPMDLPLKGPNQPF